MGYLRQKGRAYGISGGADAIIRVNAKALVAAAAAVHNEGLTVWIRSIKK
jgi:hypothetical protein